MSIAESKARVRAEVRSARTARPVDKRARDAEAIAQHSATLLPSTANAVSAYLSLPTEPGTDPLIALLRAAGHPVVVPRINGRTLDWIRLGEEPDLRTGPMGIREPAGDPEPADALSGLAVLFLPGLAVDEAGVRLGQGGGFYDAALRDVPSHADGGPLRVIVLHDDEVRVDVPHDDLDARVDCAVTPNGVVRFER